MSKFKSLKKSFIAFMLVLMMILQTIGSVVQTSSFADNQEDKVTLTIKDTANGKLQFENTNENTIKLIKGSNIKVLVNPEIGYEAKTVKLINTKNEKLELPIIQKEVNIPVIADATISADFIKSNDQPVEVKEKAEKNLDVEIQTEKVENKVADTKDDRDDSVKESIDDSKTIAEILLNADRTKVGEGTNVIAKDVVTVANTLIDMNKTKARTLDDFWVDKNKDNIFDNYQALEWQFDSLVALYEVNKNADYYVAKPNLAKIDNSKFLEYQIADSNMMGVQLDGVVYDKNTGLLYVPKKILFPNDPKYKRKETIERFGRTRIQFLIGLTKPIKQTKTEVKVNIEKNDTIEGNVSNSGKAEINTMAEDTKIVLAKDEKAKKSLKANSIDEIRINGHEINLNDVTYYEKEGVLELPTKPADIENVEVKISNSVIKNIKNTIGSLFLPAKSLASKPRANAFITPILYFSKAPNFNDVWDLKGTNISTARANALYEKVSPGGVYGSDRQSFNTVKALLDHTLTKRDADIIGNVIGTDSGFAYYTRHSTIAKQLVPGIHASSNATLNIKNGFNLSLNCAHANVGADFQWGSDATKSGRDNYGVRIRLLDTDRKTWALFGIVSPSENGQAGFGFFGARIEVEPPKPEYGDIRIEKYDSKNTNKKLPNVVFGLYDDNKELERTNITNSSGITEFKNVKYGKHYIKEEATIEGYKLSSKFYEADVSEKTKVIQIKVPNEPIEKGKIVINKVSNDDIAINLTGAKFNIISAKDNKVVDTIVTKNGVGVSKDLPYGLYYIKEIESPEYFEINSQLTKVDINENASYDVKVVNSRQFGEINIIKKDKDTNSNLQNSKFVLYVPTDIDNLMKKDANLKKYYFLDKNIKNISNYPSITGYIPYTEKISNKDGVISYKNLMKLKEKDIKYLVKEIKAPEKYYISGSGNVEFTINRIGIADSKQRIVFNEHERQIKVIKKDENGKLLSNAEFTLFKKEGSNLSKISSQVTNQKGEIDFVKLEKGQYVLRETKAPNGFRPYSKDIEIDLEKQKSPIYTITINNYKVKENIPETGTTGMTAFLISGIGILGLAYFLRKKALV